MPWQTYDAEHYRIGDEPGNPDCQELGVTGTKVMTNSENRSDVAIRACDEFLTTFFRDGDLLSNVVGGSDGDDDPHSGVLLVSVAIGRDSFSCSLPVLPPSSVVDGSDGQDI